MTALVHTLNRNMPQIRPIFAMKISTQSVSMTAISGSCHEYFAMKFAHLRDTEALYRCHGVESDALPQLERIERTL